MIEVFQWKEDFVTGNEELDNEHKELFTQINKLYKMFSDTKKYNEQISLLTAHLESIMVEHFEIENKLLKVFDISGKEDHMLAHDEIANSIAGIKDYKLPAVIAALLICDIIINYFLEHFNRFDKNFIAELNEKKSMGNNH